MPSKTAVRQPPLFGVGSPEPLTFGEWKRALKKWAGSGYRYSRQLALVVGDDRACGYIREELGEKSGLAVKLPDFVRRHCFDTWAEKVIETERLWLQKQMPKE